MKIIKIFSEWTRIIKYRYLSGMEVEEYCKQYQLPTPCLLKQANCTRDFMYGGYSCRLRSKCRHDGNHLSSA